MSGFYNVRNSLQPLRERATALAQPPVHPVRASGSATGSASVPMPTGDTVANAQGQTVWAAQYDVDNYDDPRAVYVEDLEVFV